MNKLVLFLLGGIVALVAWGLIYASYQRATRPPVPPDKVGLLYPWGAMHVDSDQEEEYSKLEESMMASFRSERSGGFDPDRLFAANNARRGYPARSAAYPREG